MLTEKQLIAGRRLTKVAGNRDISPGLAFGQIGAPRPPVTPDVAWWDPSNIGSITFTADNTVSSITDLSGAGNALSISAGAVPLARIPGGTKKNMMPYLSFAWTGSYLTSNASRSDATDSAFVVGCLFDYSTFPTLIGQQGGTGGTQFHVGNGGSVDVYNSEIGSYSISTGNGVFIKGIPFVAGYRSTGGASSTLYYNNNSYSGTLGTPSASRTTRIGMNGNSFGNNDYTRWFIGEIMIFGSTLSTTDAPTVVSYLMSKWGI
jgi:hypothetical protein